MMHLAILAEQAPLQGGSEGGSVLDFVIENPFALALTVIFLVALIGAFVAARKRDRCLAKFRKHPVTIEEQTGRRIWGLLKVFSKGLELVYESPFEEPAKNSFLIYAAELGRVLSIRRFVDRLDGEGRRQRDRQTRKMADPPLAARIRRWARNIVNTFRDAIVQAMGMSVQQAAKTSPSPGLKAQGGQVTAIGTMLVGETANAYEPMIEQYIGRPVILELVNPADESKRAVEYHGYLGEYSAQFILLVGVRDRSGEHVPLDGRTSSLLEGTLRVRAEPTVVHVENRSAVPVVVEGVRAGDVCHDIDARVEPGATADVNVPEGARREDAAAVICWERTFDLIVPRAAGVIRHASEPAERADEPRP